MRPRSRRPTRDLATRLSRRLGCSRSKAEWTLREVIAAFLDELAELREVRLSGLGKLIPVVEPSGIKPNNLPGSTAEVFETPAKVRVRFQFFKSGQEVLNERVPLDVIEALQNPRR